MIVAGVLLNSILTYCVEWIIVDLITLNIEKKAEDRKLVEFYEEMDKLSEQSHNKLMSNDNSVRV